MIRRRWRLGYMAAVLALTLCPRTGKTQLPGFCVGTECPNPLNGRPCPGNGVDDIMVNVGPLCVDVYEASLWSGVAGGSQITAAACSGNGNHCGNLFARSVEGVVPVGSISWFQAQQACANSGKRLLTNAEWQMAAAGTPDDGSCNVTSGAAVEAGSFGSCVSDHGVHDMVGNRWEWVGDWAPRSDKCPGWLGFSNDSMCLAGADPVIGPGALVRGGDYNDSVSAGVFAISAGVRPADAFPIIGFRCVR